MRFVNVGHVLATHKKTGFIPKEKIIHLTTVSILWGKYIATSPRTVSKKAERQELFEEYMKQLDILSKIYEEYERGLDIKL